MMAGPAWLVNDVNKTLGDSRPRPYAHIIILYAANALRASLSCGKGEGVTFGKFMIHERR